MTVGGLSSVRIAIGVLTAGVVVLAVGSGLRTRSWRQITGEREAEQRGLVSQVAALDARAGDLQAQIEKLGSARLDAPYQMAPRYSSGESADLARRISDLETSLKSAAGSLSDLQLHTRQLEDKAAETAAETAALGDKQTDLRKRLADADSVVQAMESELRGKENRLAPLELSSRNLHTSRQAAADAIDRQVGPARAMEDLQRRRETYLNSLLGRYRQLVEQSRFLSMQADNPAGVNPAATLDLSRVQSVVSQAEEEQRQIQALDAQAQLVLDRMRKQR